MITNVTKNKVISARPFQADDFVSRLRGMIGRRFTDFDAMVFPCCSSIHTLFMSIPIDVIFLDRDNEVVKLEKSFPPWRPCLRSSGAFAVIEMPEGTIESADIECGDVLDLYAVRSSSDSEKLNLNLYRKTDVEQGNAVFPRSKGAN